MLTLWSNLIQENHTKIEDNIPQEIIDHVQNGTYYVTAPHIDQCIDGRRTSQESNFWVSIPGGTIWRLASMIATIESTDIPKTTQNYREILLDILIDYAGWKNNLSFHNDEKNCWTWEIWCGHIKFLLDPTLKQKYWLSEESIDFIKQTLSELEKVAKINTLKGTHEEKWILVVNSRLRSVHANVNGHQLFIYSPRQIRDANKEIAKRIFEKFRDTTNNSDFDVEHITDMLQEQTNNHLLHTASKLAHWLPIFAVKHFRNGNIKYISDISEILELQ